MDRPKLEMAGVFRRYGEAYREKHGASMSTAQRRVMTAIEVCRTAALGGQIEQCDQCGHQRICYRSCRNRHCPKCQSLARAEWIQRRQAELLECQYFHVVFTLPEQLAAIAYQNKEVVYSILFRATAETLRTIASDPKHLGAEIGFFTVLHTWGSNLLHHPHLHCVVPGGGLSPDGTRWIPASLDSFCRCAYCHDCSGAYFWNISSARSIPANSDSSPRWRVFEIPPTLPVTWNL
jgi:Transposase zinc-binding domain/Putative transposase